MPPKSNFGAPRKSRLCREIKALEPSFDASQKFHMASWSLVDACLKNNLVDKTETKSELPKRLVEFNESVRFHSHTLKINVGLARGAEDSERLAKRLKDMAHVRDLKSQNYVADFAHASYVNPKESERTGLCARNRLNGALRDHSNAVAIVCKATPTKASNLQISRIPIASVGTSEISYQFATAVILGIAGSVASVTLGNHYRDPIASGALTGSEILRLPPGDDAVFVVAHAASEFLQNTPRFLTPQSLLEKTRALSRAELSNSEISRVVNQTTDHLRFTCFRIVPEDTASDGSRIWFAFSLISYLAIDPRLHTVLEKWGFNEYDLSICHAMLNYARRLVGNRSRDALSKMGKLACDSAKRTLEISTDGPAQVWKTSSARFVDDEGSEQSDDEDGLDTESVVSASTASVVSSGVVRVVKLSDIASATRVACTHELARKSRRIDTEPTTVTAASSMARSAPRNSPKASSRAVAASGMSGAPRVKATLEFLHLHFSQNDGLLMHLYADTEAASINASKCVLQAQLESKNINRDLHNTLTDNLCNAARASAIQTRENVRIVCDQKPESSPGIASWVESNGSGSAMVYTGLRTRPQGGTDNGQPSSNCRLLVCYKPPSHIQPDPRKKSCVVWCVASSTTTTCDESSNGAIGGGGGGAMEAFRALVRATRNGANKRILSKRQQRVKKACSKTLGPGETGIARSVIVFQATVPISSEVLSCAFGVAAQVVKKHAAFAAAVAAGGGGGAAAASSSSSTAAEPTELLDAATPSPGVTPSNVFTVGMYLLECSRTALNQIAPKQSLLAVPIAPESVTSSIESKESKRVNPLSRPWTFLNLNDIKFEAKDPVKLNGRLEQDFKDAQEGSAPPIHCKQVGLDVVATVTGDCAIDVPTALGHLGGLLVDRPDIEGRLSLLRQWRSVCFTAGIQCSTFHQFSNSVSSREMNTKIEGTSKVEAPDNNYLAFPTIAQAYIVGHTNLPTMFEGTPWMDVYGAGYECGAIAACGINGRMIVSDQRNAAFALMDQEQVDTLCKKLAGRSVVVDHEGKSFLRVPLSELGGLPRQMIPGVHLALKGLEAAFQNLPTCESTAAAAGGGGEGDDMRKSIQILPFSPFTQAVPSNVVADPSGMDFRDRAKTVNGLGAADIPTSTEHARPLRTLKRLSILGSEFMAPACVKMICSAVDNVFESIEPAFATLLVFASQIGEIAKLVANICGGGATPPMPPTPPPPPMPPISIGEALSTLRRESLAFFDGGVTIDVVCVPHLVVDALVLFNSMFPLEFEVGKPTLLQALSKAPTALFSTSSKASFAELHLADVTAEDRVALLRFVRRLFDDTDSGPWSMLADFISMVMETGGKFDNSEHEMQTAARITSKLGEVVWKIHSDDGMQAPEKWSPLHCRSAPADVTSTDLVCVWTDRPLHSVLNRKSQRGALFGIPNAGPQQVLMLLCGAFLKDVTVQYFRNEGNMCLRMSSCALKEDSDGVRLTAKSTSPIYSDNDSESYGTLLAKEAQARRQVVAWRENNELIFEIGTRFDFPRGDTNRFKGSNFHLKQVMDLLAKFDSSGRVSTEECLGAALMGKACLFSATAAAAATAEATAAVASSERSSSSSSDGDVGGSENGDFCSE